MERKYDVGIVCNEYNPEKDAKEFRYVRLCRTVSSSDLLIYLDKVIDTLDNGETIQIHGEPFMDFSIVGGDKND